MKQFTLNGKTYTQVQKRTAEKMIEEGKTIYLAPCKANPYYIFFQFAECNQRLLNETNYIGVQRGSRTAFQCFVNSFEVYNCNNQMGTYASFYIMK